MIGLPRETDWSEFTRTNRLIDQDLPYGKIREPWQKEIDEGIANFARVYLQLPRGHDKTERFAWWSLLWLETTSASRGYAAGVDRDNARLFRDAAKKIKALHPDLFQGIEVEKHVVYSKETGSYIETISSDVNSAYGLNFDLLIVNDFHAWNDFEFWEVLWTACEKRKDIRVWMESNALTLGTPGAQWVSKFRKWVREFGAKQFTSDGRKEWFYYVPTKFLATWQMHAMDQWRATLMPATFRRLIENCDTSGEESFLTEDQVMAVTTLGGPTDKRLFERGPTVTAVDIGLVKDATAITTVQLQPGARTVDKNGKTTSKAPHKLYLLAQDVLTGSYADPVKLEEAERIAFEHKAKFKSFPILVDAWNAASLLQRFPGTIEKWDFTGSNIHQMTSILYRLIADKHLQIYPNAGKGMHSDGEEWTLQRELISAVVKEMSYGSKVDHRSGGYSDRLISLGMACHKLLQGAVPRADTAPTGVKKDDNSHDAIVDKWIKDFDRRGRLWQRGVDRISALEGRGRTPTLIGGSF